MTALRPRVSRPAAAAILLPFAALLGAMVSVTFGATFAERLFPLVGAQGATTLRLGLGAIILLAALRPWRTGLPLRGLPLLVAYGATIGAMNLMFYLALRTIPLGIAVSLEFTGPLALALAHSRRWSDVAWVALAVAGLLLLLPVAGIGSALDPAGALYALGAGALWALYATLGRKAGAAHGPSTVAFGLAIGACLVAPFGLAHAGAALFTLPALLAAAVVAVFSSALPFWLEMMALVRLPARAYGTLTSLEPALGAMMGFVFLHERPTLAQAAGIALVIAASAGTAATMRPARPAA